MVSLTTIVLMVGVSALLSALLTVGVFLVVADRLLRRRLEGSAEKVGEVVAGKVRAAVADAVDDALPRLRSEVSGGVQDGAAEVLPKVRREVENGVSDAADHLVPKLRSQISEGISEALTGGVLGKAGEELARKGGNVLDVLLGSRDSEKE
jgi:hypothetical protein